MSKIGKQPIEIPAEVEVLIKDDLVSVNGSKGKLELRIAPKIKLAIEDKKIIVSRLGEDKQAKANQGTTRQLIANMIKGVKEGWVKVLEIQGTGYRASLSGKNLVLSLGFSHPVEIIPPEGIEFQVEKNEIKVIGADKALVGQETAKIRKIRPPDVYKGKGIRYLGEVIKLKPGKAAKTIMAGGAPA